MPPEFGISASHVLIAGKITHVSWNKSRIVTIEGRKHKARYRVATIQIDEVLKNDLVGIPIGVGGTVKCQIPAKFRFRRKGVPEGSSIAAEEGMEGVWTLWYCRDSLVLYSLMGFSATTGDLPRIRSLVQTVRAAQTPELEAQVLAEETRRREILSLPACPANVIEAAIRPGNGLPRATDLSRVHVVSNLGTTSMGTLFLDSEGNILGGLPHHADGTGFHEGRLRVATKLENNVYGGYRFVGPDGELLPEPLPDQVGEPRENSRAPAPPPSETLSAFRADGADGAFGYRDASGNVAIAPAFWRADEFHEGRAAVRYASWERRPEVSSDDGKVRLSPDAPRYRLMLSSGLIDRQGKLVNPVGLGGIDDFRNGLARVSVGERRLGGKHITGFMDRDGKIVFVLSSSGTAAPVGDMRPQSARE